MTTVTRVYMLPLPSQNSVFCIFCLIRFDQHHQDQTMTTPHPSRFSPQAKIYVAGHRGLVGSAIVRELHRRGFDNLILKTSQELDLRNQQAVQGFYREYKPDYVFIAAAKVGGIWANDNYPAQFLYDNLMIEANLIHGAYESGVQKLLFLGSTCIYPKMAPQPLKEEYLLTGPLEPTNEWYAIAKIAGIKLCQAYRRQYGCNFISAMPTNLYGPGDNFDLDNSHVLPALIRKFHLAKLAAAGDIEAIQRDEERYGRIPDDILHNLALQRDPLTNYISPLTPHTPQGEALTLHRSKPSPLTSHTSRGAAPPHPSHPKVVLWGTGSPCREFLHVEDCARACLHLLENHEGEDIVNIGVGEDVTIRELAELVQEIVGFDGKVIWDESKPDGTPRKLVDVTRIHGLGWHAEIDLPNGIEQVYEWYLSSCDA